MGAIIFGIIAIFAIAFSDRVITDEFSKKWGDRLL
jgi:hypothetical protein